MNPALGIAEDVALRGASVYLTVLASEVTNSNTLAELQAANKLIQSIIAGKLAMA
jgi:ribosome-binding factor A